MTSLSDDVLTVVTESIRRTINEDWVYIFEITPQSCFYNDLEIESIEFVKIALAIQKHYGPDLDIVGWLSTKDIHQLIGLTVGDLTDYINTMLSQI